MSNKFGLACEIRQDTGKGSSRRLRRLANSLPAIIYGGDTAPQMITLKQNEVRKAIENEAFFSHILHLDVAGTKESVVLKAIQRHPYKLDIMHMDFLRVMKGEALTMTVPLHFTGQDDNDAINNQGGIAAHTVAEVEIKCLPANLPEYIEVSMATLEMDHTLHLSDIKLPKGVEIVALMHDEDHDHPIASIHLPRAEKEEAEESADAPVADDAASDNEEK